MMITRNKYKVLLTVVITTMLSQFTWAQTIDNDFQLRTEAIIQKKLTESVKIYFTPEIRWDNAVSPDKYLLETSLEYKVMKGLTVQGGYRFIINPKDTKATEYMHRFAFSTTYKKSFGRFDPSVRLKYTNYTEDASSGDFMKFRAKVAYDIPKSKITPFVAAEGYYDFSENNIYKYRYSTGLKYKLNKQNSIGATYMFDYYMQEYKNKHVIGLKYKYSF